MGGCWAAIKGSREPKQDCFVATLVDEMVPSVSDAVNVRKKGTSFILTNRIAKLFIKESIQAEKT